MMNSAMDIAGAGLRRADGGLFGRRLDVYRHRDNGVVPFQVADVNYWLSGETPALIPDDYFTDCRSMLALPGEEDSTAHGDLRRRLYPLPVSLVWDGRDSVGAGGQDPLSAQDGSGRAGHGRHPPRAGAATCRCPIRIKDGLMPRVLETIRYFREHSDLPISFTDPQGPFTTALTLAGPATLFVWLYEYPQAVHELMEFCTEAFIRWIKVQKQEIGEERSRCCFPHGIILPERFGKVWLCDDDCGAISPAQYREFVVPYNARVFREFGGGTLHFCGSAEHQIENLAATEGLVGVNNFCMGNFRQIYRHAGGCSPAGSP